MNFFDFYHNKKVLVTGHTGFKGSWLCVWLKMLGAKVAGYSIGIPTSVSMYESLNITKYLEADFRGDVANEKEFQTVLEKFQPEIVIHLAAQPIVLKSYTTPLETFQTNIMGTASVLNCIRRFDCIRCSLIITTDKCYKNKGWIWGYREIDELGGDDPYSCSKACAELITDCYIKSFFQSSQCSIATARAGNVIGGGDWAEHRLVPDIVRSAFANQPVVLRHPDYVRPWQHVMEPLYGYLLLCKKLYENGNKFSGAWNFGPNMVQSADVGYIANKICSILGCSILNSEQSNQPHESALLSLDCSKAKQKLGWNSILSLDQTLQLTAEWYENYRKRLDMLQKTKEQLTFYMKQISSELE